jgi:protein-disulfide isomerase
VTSTPPEGPAGPAENPESLFAPPASPASPAPEPPNAALLEWRLKRAKRVNIVLGVLAALLAVVLVATQTEPFRGAASQPTATVTVTAAPTAAATAAAEPVNIERRDPNDTMALGAIDAPIVLSEFADLRCPYCAVFHRETFPAIVAQYVDTGKVRIEFHDVSYFGDDSTAAAVAARAAGQQGKYFDYLDVVFQNAPESGHPDLPRETLLQFGLDAAIPDTAAFEAALDDPTLEAAVLESTSNAQQLGVSSVPFFVVGTQAIAGAQPLESFQQFLDQQLAEA